MSTRIDEQLNSFSTYSLSEEQNSEDDALSENVLSSSDDEDEDQQQCSTLGIILSKDKTIE